MHTLTRSARLSTSCGRHHPRVVVVLLYWNAKVGVYLCNSRARENQIAARYTNQIHVGFV